MGNIMPWYKDKKEPGTIEDYDSTWNSDSEQDEPCSSQDQNEDKPATLMKPRRSFHSAKDLYIYRHDYPNLCNSKSLRHTNLMFYTNKTTCQPDGIYIRDILTQWKGDYEKLERNHNYIQWLFPLREPGLNWHAQELNLDEIEGFLKSDEAKNNYLQAYEMMLDFFGITLEDRVTGTVTRASNYTERFQHLNESRHNYLRITRILKSLGEFKYDQFQYQLVLMLLTEVLVERTLANMAHSALEYFVFTIKLPKDRRKLLRFARCHYSPPENFIWGPPKKTKSKATSSPSKRRASPQDRAQPHNSSGEVEGPASKNPNIVMTTPDIEGPGQATAAGHSDSETSGKGEEIVSQDAHKSTEGEAQAEGEKARVQEEKAGSQGKKVGGQGEKAGGQGMKAGAQGKKAGGQGEKTGGQSKKAGDQGEAGDLNEKAGDKWEKAVSQGKKAGGKDEKAGSQGKKAGGQDEKAGGQDEKARGQDEKARGQDEAVDQDEKGKSQDEAGDQDERARVQDEKARGKGEKAGGKGEVAKGQRVIAENQQHKIGVQGKTPGDQEVKVEVQVDKVGGQEEIGSQGDKVGDQEDKVEGQEEVGNQGDKVGDQENEVGSQGVKVEGQMEEARGRVLEAEDQGDKVSGRRDKPRGQREKIGDQGDKVGVQGDKVEGQENQSGDQDDQETSL